MRKRVIRSDWIGKQTHSTAQLLPHSGYAQTMHSSACKQSAEHNKGVRSRLLAVGERTLDLDLGAGRGRHDDVIPRRNARRAFHQHDTAAALVAVPSLHIPNNLFLLRSCCVR